MDYVKRAEELASNGDMQGLTTLGIRLRRDPSPEAELGMQAVRSLTEVAMRNAMMKQASVQPD